MADTLVFEGVVVNTADDNVVVFEGVVVNEDQAAAAGSSLLSQMLQQGLYSGSMR